ncbi:MAG TPA: hypothetical protein VHK91_12845, partial [Flavisolibacter sp.]|nr:hypothetical protein [Flavisolibacter sp.]
MKNILCCLALAVIACTARALPPTILGSLYSKNSWTTTSDFIPNGTSTVALSSGFIRLGVNGTPDFTYPGSNSIYITSYQTKLEKWNLKARFKILSNGVGIGFGLNSSNSVSSARHDIMGFVQTIAGGDGDLYLMNTRGQKLVSFQHNHYAINDIIDVELDFNVNVVNFTIQNQTNGETHTLSYTYSSTSNQYVVPNTSHFALMELGGSHELRDLQVSSNEITYSNLVVIGDSKTSSQYADAFSLRYA